MDNIVDKIMEIVRELSAKEQIELRKELVRITLDEVNPTVLDVACHYIGVMNKIVKRDVREPSRERRVVDARIILGYFLYREGLTNEKIGQLLGKDHSTVVHYRRLMADALSFPQTAPQLMLLYNKFLKAIE